MLGEFIKKLVKSSPIPLISANNKPTLVLWVLCFVCVVIIPLSIMAFFLKSSMFGGKESDTSVKKPKRIRPDFSGVWKRTAFLDDNLPAFVAATGASVLQRRLAATMPSFHTLTMDKDGEKLRLQEKCGPVDTDISYTIQDPADKPVRTEFRIKVQEREYEDSIAWSGAETADVLVMKRLHVPEKDFEIEVRWSLDSVSLTKGADGEEAPRTMRVENTCHVLNKGKRNSAESITTCATYTYMGPAVQPQSDADSASPPSSPAPEKEGAGDAAADSDAEQ